MKHNLKTLEKAMSRDYKTHKIEYYTTAHEELLNLIKELQQLKQDLLMAKGTDRRGNPNQYTKRVVQFIDGLFGEEEAKRP